MRRSAAFLAAALLLAACSGTYTRPEIELEGITVGSLGLTGGTLLANIRVHNPNRFNLRANDLRYELYLRKSASATGDSAWTRFADGTYGDTITVRGAGGNILDTGRLDYRAVGTVDVKTPLGNREVPFRKTGTFMMSGVSR